MHGQRLSPPAALPATDWAGSAFGLALSSDFPLPGVAPSSGEAAGLPRCALELVGEPDLLERWSGPLSDRAWRGSLKDGLELTIRWGTAGDLLCRYGPRALFHLDPDASLLRCAVAEPAATDWQRVLCSRVLPLVALAHGREAVHAGAVETPAGVVAIAGPSGAGKSTLTAALTERGHRLFSDDVLVLAGGDQVLAHPGGPYLTLAAGAVAAPPGQVLDTVADKRWIAVPDAGREPRPVAAVVLLERGVADATEISSLASSPLHLAPFMLGLPDQPERDGARFALYSDLVEGAELLRLRTAPSDSPDDVAAALERALGIGEVPA
ncbi:MAG TPA: hypothetical protein VLK37_13860 [Solirubrobacterales bacterium]|nr:hypothetical protein [Solirubrobacterales bacterium]